jgi:hypothetical protein
MIDINAHYLIVYEEEGTLFIGPFPTAEQADDHPVSSLFDRRVVSGEWLKAACATIEGATEEICLLIESPERHLVVERDRFFETVQMSEEEGEYWRAHREEMRIDQINFPPDATEEIQPYKEIIRVEPRLKIRHSRPKEAAGESPWRLH